VIVGGISGDARAFETAVESSQQALAALERALGLDHFDTINARLNHGIVLSAAGHDLLARTALERSIADLERVRGPDEPGIAVAHENLGLVLLDLGDPDAAVTHLQRAVVVNEATRGADHPSMTALRNHLREAQEAHEGR
jgi:tetratricopeptide (TPR) repeat protein